MPLHAFFIEHNFGHHTNVGTPKDGGRQQGTNKVYMVFGLHL